MNSIFCDQVMETTWKTSDRVASINKECHTKLNELNLQNQWNHLLLHYTGFEVMSDSFSEFLCILSIPSSHLQRKVQGTQRSTEVQRKRVCFYHNVSTSQQSLQKTLPVKQICPVYNHPVTAGPITTYILFTLKLHLSLICLFRLRSISTTSSPSRVLESPGVRLPSGAAT